MRTDDASSAAFQLCCLGQVALIGPDGGSRDLRTRKVLALLLLLARQAGRAMSRDALIELLWPGDPASKARHSLSQSVSLVNKALGVEAVVAADRDRVLLRPDLVWLDANAFERSAAAGDQEEARRLWRGTLLEGFWIARAAGFERWLAEERGRLERTRRRVAHGIIEERRAEGDYQAMRVEAESLLDLDALDEKAMLACLEALQLAGDRTIALRRYGEFEKRLKVELDAEPGAALRGWARRNRKGDSEAGLRYVPIPRVAEMTVLPSPQPIFGRVEEFAQLWSAWEQTKTGKGAFIILEGEAGIGKTALATKLANQVHVAGGSVCFVRCYRAEKSVPFAPVTALIRQLSRLPGFVALDPVWIGELTRLVPELRERYPGAPQPMAADDAARHRLSDATVQAALAVADEQPLLIVVDDLQDADEATLAALHYLGRQSASQPILFVGGHRREVPTSELERAFFDATGPEAARHMAIARMPAMDVERLVLHVLARSGSEVTAEALRRLVTDSGGNPLQAMEVALSASCRLESTRRDHVAHKDLEGSAFDASAADRLCRLSNTALLIARAIAVAGRPLSGYELASVTRLGIAAMATGIAELEGLQFLRRLQGGLALSHERYTQAVEAQLDNKTRRSLHFALARLLQQSAAKNPAARYDVSRHYQACGRMRQARLHALAAARHAQSLGGLRERASALQLALDVSRGFDQGIGVELGQCLLDLRDLEALDKLCQIAEAQDLDAESSAAFRYLGVASAAEAGRANLCQTAVALSDILSSQPHFRLAPAARTRLMRAAYRSGDFRTAHIAGRLLRRRGSGENSIFRGRAYAASAYIASKYYSPKRALPLLRRALEEAQARQDLDLEHLCRQGLGAISRQLGRFKDAVAEHEVALALAHRALNSVLAAEDASDVAVAEMALGNHERAHALFEQASTVLENQPDPHGPSFVRANHGELFLGINDLDRASSLFESALQKTLWLRDLPTTIQALGGLALCAQRRGSQSELARWAGQLRSIANGSERKFHERWLAEAALAWDVAITDKHPDVAVSQLRRAAYELRRIDVEHWLMVELELLRLRDACLHAASPEDICALAELARTYGAGTVLRGVTELREKATHQQAPTELN